MNKKDILNITLVQSSLFSKKKKKNLDHFLCLLKNIKSTDLILLPEMFNTDFFPKELFLAEEMDGDTVKWMKNIAYQKNCAIAGTLMIKEHSKVFNRLVWVTREGQIYTYDKRHLFSYIKEHETLTKGKDRLIVKMNDWKICPLICYDLRFPVFSRNTVDYDLLIYLANWPVKRIDAWNTLLKARSIENQCFTIGLNRVGEDMNSVHFNGNTKVFDAFGKLIFSAEENKEEVLQVNLQLDDLRLKRRQMNFLQDRDEYILV